MNKRDIRRQLRDIRAARTKKMQDAMRDYDANVFYPSIRAAQELCCALGHNRDGFHDNGLGWVFISCSDCGAMLEKRGPEGEVIVLH